MDIYGIPMGVDAYIAKFIDENGCTFEEACEQLEIDRNEVINFKYEKDSIY